MRISSLSVEGGNSSGYTWASSGFLDILLVYLSNVQAHLEWLSHVSKEYILDILVRNDRGVIGGNHISLKIMA